MREERERLVDELLAANQKFQGVVTWFEVICTMTVTFFRNLHQLDEWTKRVEEKFSPENLPKQDAAQMDQLVREHEAARQTVSQMIKFAHTEGDQICSRSRQPDVPNEVNREAQKIPDLISRRVKRWEEIWTKQHRQIEQYSGTAKIQQDLNELLETVSQLDQKLTMMKLQVGTSPESAQAVTSEYREFERNVNFTDQRISSFTSTVLTGPFRSQHDLKQGADTLKKRWREFRVRLNNFNQTLETATEYFTLIEQTEIWIQETTEFISVIGKRAESCKSSEEAHQLGTQLDQYMKPRIQEQNQKMKRLQKAAVMLHGEGAEHKIQHLEKRYKEIVDSFVEISDRLKTSAEYCILIEQIEIWIKETTEYIREVGRRAQSIQSSEEANRLMGQLEQYMKTKQPEQEDRMQRLEATSRILHGENSEHNLKHIKKKYKEIIDSFVLVSDNLFSMAESCRQIEAKKLQESLQKPPRFEQPLKDGQIMEGNRFEFMCRVSGDPQPDVVWYKDGVPIVNNPDYEITYQNGVCVLKIEETFTEDSAVFMCRATNVVGSAETQARLVVKESPLLRMEPPDFTQKLSNATVTEGEHFIFECRVTGNPVPSISWYKNEHSVDLESSIRTSFSNGVCKLVLQKAMQQDEARYTCRASNPAGQAATSATLSVAARPEPPVIKKHLTPQNLQEGDKLFLECHVIGKPQPQVTWTCNNRELVDSREIRISYDGYRASLTMNEVVPESYGMYKIVARNQAGEASSACSISVQQKVVKMETSESEIEGQKPRFVQELRNVTVVEETFTRLDCVIVGVPEPEVIWFKEDQPVRESEHVQLHFQGDKCSLVIPKSRLQDSGLYKCTARNSMGETTSFCRLTVQSLQPAIPCQPPRILPLLQNQTLTAGQRCMFEARVTGEPEPKITWEHQDRKLVTSSEFQILKDDNGWNRLVISRITPDHAGTFSITAVNSTGEAKSTATLTVNPPVPVKPVTPIRELSTGRMTATSHVMEEFFAESHTGVSPSATAPEFVKPFAEEYRAPIGQRARLDCLLVGNPRPKVTWFFNSQSISSGFCQMTNVGDTYAIVIPQVRPEHQGQYTIKAENIRGETECTTRLVVTKKIEEFDRAPPPTTATHLVSSNYMASQQQQQMSQRQKIVSSGPLVQVKPSGQAPHFQHTLISVVCTETEQAKFEATVIGVPPPDVTWQKDGFPISSSTHPEIKFSHIGNQVSMVITNTKMSHSGKYTCTAKNSSGFATSSAQLLVQAQTNAPDFIQRLISREVMEGESMRWEVKVVGDPPPKVSWYRNGALIPHCQDVQLLDEKHGVHVLYIPHIEQADAGQFTVRAENIAGEARSTADLVVRPKGARPGQYYHVTRVTQEKQELGMEIVRDSKYGDKESSQPAIKAPRM